MKTKSDQSDFMNECVPDAMAAGYEQDQAVAMCLHIFLSEEGRAMNPHKDNGKVDSGKAMDCEPEDDENQDDFMDRCINEEGNDPDACSLAWENRSVKGIVHKTHAGKLDGHDFILSDETPDRVGDIIEANGWEFSAFTKNPIALFAHDPRFAIGKWSGVHVKDKELRGHLELAPKGSSARIDEIRALVDCGVLRAVSVGFKPIDSFPINPKDPWSGSRFTKQELVECSLVAVPANPNALIAAKAMKISDDTMKLVFAGQGKENRIVTRGVVTGGQAKAPPNGKSRNMTPLTKRITDCEGRITGLREALAEHLGKLDDTNVSDEDMSKTNEMNAAIATAEKTLDMLKSSEQHIAKATVTEQQQQHTSMIPANGRTSARPFNMPTKKVDPLDFLVRAMTVQMFSHVQKRSIEDTRGWLAQNYSHYDDEGTKVYVDWLARAATAPAMTTVAGWAAELVQTVYSAFMETLMPKSIFPRLSAKGLTLDFGRAGRISVPTRALTPSIAGSFVGEGQPIPVRQAAFAAQILTPKKMAVITTWTREIDVASVPAIEGLLRQAIQDDTAIAIDSVLLDANPATAIRPAGLLNGVTPLTATAGGGFNALVGDIKQLTGALLTATRGNVRAPVFIMNPQQVLSAGLTPAPSTGTFPFDTSGGQLNGWPIIDSGTVPMGEVIAMDAADFVSAGESPRFEISDSATIHEEDTAPLPIVGGGGTPVTANPVRSLWQTDSLGLRMILPMTWANRRPGTVAAISGVTW
jgi:HK97 family phage prohead protease/HK97 family phage major capsid protein